MTEHADRMTRQIRDVGYVLVIASPEYKLRAEGDAMPGEGRGVQWEARLIRDRLYADQKTGLRSIVPVVLPGCSASDVPLWMGPVATTHYLVRDYTVTGAEKLLRLLTGQPAEVVPPLGKLPFLPPRSARQSAPGPLAGATPRSARQAGADLPSRAMNVAEAKRRVRRVSLATATIVIAAITATGGIIVVALNLLNSSAGPPQPSVHNTTSVTSTAPSRTPTTGPPISSGPLIPGDNDTFIIDITYKDGSKVIAGQRFTKKWEIKNIGSVPWVGRYLAPRGPSIGRCTYPPRVPVPTTYPGQKVIISVPVTAPPTPGMCFVTWKMVTVNGALYFPNQPGVWFWVYAVSRGSH